MADEQPTSVSGGRRRTRGAEAMARSNALERLKALRSGGRRSENGGAFQIKMEKPVYDTVPEDEYDALVAKRREEAKGFIVDDDGLGYGDEGEEEDWSVTGLPPSSDESEGENERPKNRKKGEKKDPPVKKPPPSSLSAASIGNQRLSSMFTSSVFKKSYKDDQGKASCADSIVDDVIAEFAPDDIDRLKRRRGTQSVAGLNGTAPLKSVKTECLSDGFCDLMSGSLNSNSEEIVVNFGAESNGVVDDCKFSEESKRKNVIRECNDGDSEIKNGDGISKVVQNVVEAKVEEVSQKKEEAFILNAIITEEKDPSKSASAGWKEVMSGSRTNGATNKVDGNVASEITNADFDFDADGSLPFYIVDAHEEQYGANRGIVYLFGKVKTGNTYQSCCVVVKNMQRCVYAVPSHGSSYPDEAIKLEKELEESQISSTDFRKRLQDLASGLKNEIGKQLLNLNVSTYSMAPVKRKYAFERSEIPAGENYVLKITYPFKDQPLPTDLKGENFCALLGTQCSALELLLIKRKIRGPSWISISKFGTCSPSERVSWCKFEVTVDSPKDIRNSTSSKITAEIPPVVVAAINLKTILNGKQNVHEIVSASIVCCQRAKIDIPMLAAEWKQPGILSHFTVVRKLDGGIFPMGFTKEVVERNKRAGSPVLREESSERALLNRLMVELHKLDSDILVGHKISSFDLEVLLSRCQACKVPNSMWSKIGRLKRSMMPKLGRGFMSGASPGVMSCIAGRLLCDTHTCAGDLLKEVSYDLTELAKTQLNKERKEIMPHDVLRMFQTSETLVELIECGETDAWLSIELMFHLSILPLTRQLTNISGNLWGRTLQGSRAQRVEFLLLHAFHAKKYMVPDKYSNAKETKLSKRKGSRGFEDGINGLDVDDASLYNDASENDHGKGKKVPGYAGGLVLEPKKGLYDKYILLLDFNSLYPSIIQEYNICFTTVERSSDGTIPRLPSSRTVGVLPELLRDLVQRRKKVKSWMKNASGIKMQQFDIQQQALKLTANSMYGCLGFNNSRFYAKPLAELITLQGREILQSTVDLVQNNLNLEVIYGDTDSIMIYTGLDDIAKAKAMAGKVILEVNKKYKCLEIDLDGLYKRMLILKKKKYASVKEQFRDGKSYQIIECKGLDIVRRDWCLLSKEQGDFCLNQILSGGSCDDVVESIHSSLRKVKEEITKGQVPLEKYIITKKLSKPPEDYPDAKSQPHVIVAQRMKQNGYTSGCSVGDTIPYIICREQGGSSGASPGIAQRARHPDELKRGEGKWMVDTVYYLEQQIHPVVSRLCAFIPGTSSDRLADCLGLDSSKFLQKVNEAAGSNSSTVLLSASSSDDERYKCCEPLFFSCPSCSSTFNCPPIFSSLLAVINDKQTSPQTDESSCNFWQKLRCPKCPEEGNLGRISPAMIANQVKRQTEKFISLYYRGLLMCDDETCKHTTRSLNLRVLGDAKGTVCPNYPRCNGRLLRKYTEANLYKQLMYFCHILDTVRCLEKVEAPHRLALEKELTKIRPMVEQAASTVQRIRDRCAYGWVKLQDLIIAV